METTSKIENLDLFYVNCTTQTPMLVKSLRSILSFHPELEEHTIIVDNKSYDQRNNLKILKTEFPKARIIASTKNAGLSRAQNWSLYNSSEKYVFCLNNDTYFESPEVIPRMLDYMEKHFDTAILGPQLLNADKSLQTSCFMFYDIPTILFRRTGLGRLFFAKKHIDKILMKDFDHQSIRDVDWFRGAAMLLRRRHVFDIGLFDERYPHYFEDMDICRRLWEAGYRVTYFPEAQVVHYYQKESQSAARWLLNLLAAMFVDYKKKMPFEDNNKFVDKITKKITRLHIVSGFKYIFKYMRSDIDIRNSTLQAIEHEKHERQKRRHQDV